MKFLSGGHLPQDNEVSMKLLNKPASSLFTRIFSGQKVSPPEDNQAVFQKSNSFYALVKKTSSGIAQASKKHPAHHSSKLEQEEGIGQQEFQMIDRRDAEYHDKDEVDLITFT